LKLLKQAQVHSQRGHGLLREGLHHFAHVFLGQVSAFFGQHVVVELLLLITGCERQRNVLFGR